MKVILPTRNRLINKLFNTDNAGDGLKYLLKDNLDYVVKKSIGKSVEYEVELARKIGKDGKEKEQDGQYIIIESKKEKKYIFFTYEFPNETRNGYLVAKIPIAFRNWYFDDTTKKKELGIFLLDIDTKYKSLEIYKNIPLDNLKSSGTINNYNTFAYKLCKTLGLRIINEDKLPYSLYKDTLQNGKYQYRQNKILAKTGFSSIDNLKNMRDILAGRNTGNKSSYILEFDDMTAIYGKTFGNNGFEMVLIACAIGKLAQDKGKEACFLQIKDTLGRDGTSNRDAKPITADNINIMKAFKIKVYDELMDYEENPDVEILEQKDSRNQLEFMKNLMHKFGDTDKKECYLCHCDIQNLIIASHIHRICDINKLEIPFKERRAMAVDGDNGFWLCANHDKLFEYGFIYFEKDKMIISDRLSDMQKNFVKNITFKTSYEKIEESLAMVAEDSEPYILDEDFYIDEKDYNDNMHNYLEIHKNRVLK